MGTSSEGIFTLTRPQFAEGIIWGDTSEPIQSIYEQSATQNYQPGAKLVYSDGRVFRYAKNGGTALARALMTTSEALYARVVGETQATYGTATVVNDQEIDVDVTTGGTYVENEFAGGFLLNQSGTTAALGDIYKIVANKIDGSDDTLMRVQLETPIRNAWDASSVVTLVKSPWYDVDVMPTTAEGTPAGIPLIAVTANYYCWLQTGGYAPCIVDTGETLVKGEPAGFPATANVAGACGPIGADTDTTWGIAVSVVAAGSVAILDLKLDS